MRKDAVVWVCNILEHKGEVHRKVPDEVVTGPARLVQFLQACNQEPDSGNLAQSQLYPSPSYVLLAWGG